MTEPVPLISMGDLLRLTYAYIKIQAPATRHAILEFAENCADEQLQLPDGEQECPASSEDDAMDTVRQVDGVLVGDIQNVSVFNWSALTNFFIVKSKLIRSLGNESLY